MKSKIGDFLIKTGALKQHQVEDIIRAQQSGDKRLFGEIAVALGYMQEDSLKRFLDYLERQQGKLDDLEDAAPD